MSYEIHSKKIANTRYKLTGSAAQIFYIVIQFSYLTSKRGSRETRA